MSNLLRRLRKLEAEVIDRSGLVLHSPAWLAYWFQEIESYVADQRSPKQLLPLEAVRAWIRAQPDSD